jgi:hypothetical protein
MADADYDAPLSIDTGPTGGVQLPQGQGLLQKAATAYAQAKGSGKRGIRKVPKTGLYKLHRDEAVLTVKQAKQYRKRARKRSTK